MKYFLLSQNLEANEGYISWSEGPYKREIAPQNEYWPNLNTNRTKTGPLEAQFKQKMHNLWLVIKHQVSDIPDLLGSFSEHRFDGNPIVSQNLKDSLNDNVIGSFEFIKIENIWSITGHTKINKTYYYMNIFGQKDFFDIETSKSKKIPDFGQSATHRISEVLMSNFKIKTNSHPSEDVFRDKATNLPICSAKFLAIIKGFKTKSVKVGEITG